MMFKKKTFSSSGPECLIVGLGNPGRQYEETKHNVGFKIIDRLAEKYDIKVEKVKNKALIGDGYIRDKRVLLVKPQTYMNLSGECVMNMFGKKDFRDVSKLRIFK